VLGTMCRISYEATAERFQRSAREEVELCNSFLLSLVVDPQTNDKLTVEGSMELIQGKVDDLQVHQIRWLQLGLQKLENHYQKILTLLNGEAKMIASTATHGGTIFYQALRNGTS
jgi:hypothetical protein